MKDYIDCEIEYIFTPYVTRKGKRIYASRYGLRAFRIPVKRNR